MLILGCENGLSYFTDIKPYKVILMQKTFHLAKPSDSLRFDHDIILRAVVVRFKHYMSLIFHFELVQTTKN